MKFVYDYLSEERCAEIRRMQIVDPYGEMFVPRISLDRIKVSKSENEEYILKEIDAHHEYVEFNMEHIFLFIHGSEFFMFSIPKKNFQINKSEERIDDAWIVWQTIKIDKNDSITDELIDIVVSALREHEQYHGNLDKIVVKCRIYYNDKLMLGEF